jgi:hypothetical protein
VEHKSVLSLTKIIPLAVVNLVTPKAGAKHELLFNEPSSSTYKPSPEVIATKLHTNVLKVRVL